MDDMWLLTNDVRENREKEMCIKSKWKIIKRKKKTKENWNKLIIKNERTKNKDLCVKNRWKKKKNQKKNVEKKKMKEIVCFLKRERK